MKNTEDIIREQYPFPIASSYQALLRYQRRLSSYKQAYTLLLDLHTIVVRYLALIALSNYIQQKAFKGDFNNKLRQTLLKELTVGDWQHILRETLLVFRNQEEKLFIPALFSFYFQSDGSTLTDAGEKLEMLVKSHPAQSADTLTDAQYEERYKRELPLMLAVLQQMQFLCSYQLLVPTLIGNGKILAAYDCTGLVNEFNEITLNLPIQDESISEYRAVLVDRRNNAHQLLLYPLHVVEDDPINDILDIMIFDGLKFAKDALISLRYLAINRKTSVTLSEHNELHRSIISDFHANVSTILQLANLLVSKLKAQDTYYFTSQIDLIEAYASTFIGREDALTSFRIFREQQVNGGVFLITGAPGEGKSALAAKMIKETGAIHHFIARDEGRNIEKYIVQSLMEQLMQRYDLPGNIPDDENELRRSFGALLQNVKIICEHEHRQEIIVLDGLDELEFSHQDVRLDFLPSPLPSHIFVLLLSRPFELQGLRVNGIDQTYELGPLTPKDVEQIVRTKVPDMPVDLITQIFKYSQGNALYVHCLLKESSKTSLVGMQLPATIEELYRRVLQRLHQTDGELAYRVLGILTIAHGKLDINQLSVILRQKKREILTKGFPNIRTLLVSSQRKYGIFHKSMRDFLTNPAEEFAFDREEIQEFHQSIIDACQSDEPILEEYRLNNLPYHLYENNRLDEIIRIATLPEYTEAIINLLITHARASSSEKLEGSKLDALLKQLGDIDEPIGYKILLAFFRNIVYYGYLDYCYKLAQTLIERAKERQSDVQWLYLFAAARIVHAQGKLTEAGTLLAEVEPHLAALGPEQIAEFSFLKAETLRESGAYADARTAYETCRDMLQLQQNEPLLLDTLLHLGDLEYVRGELSAAMQTLSDALSLSETLHLQLFVGQSHRLIGQIFYIQEKYREALNHYHKALDIFTLLDNQAYLGRIYMNLAETYVPIDLDKALSFAEAAIKVDTQFDFGLELGKALFTRADIARIQKRFVDSAHDVQASIEQFLRVGHVSGLARAYRMQALLYLDQKQFENALSALDQSDESFTKIRVYPSFVLKNMITRLEIYRGMGEIQQAEETRSRLTEMGKTSELGYLVDQYFSSLPLSSPKGENA